jgi:protein-L-isoaspartate(D-aspartate) O-methyltransferase
MQKKILLNALREQKIPEKIVNAFDVIDRKEFIPEKYQANAYNDVALPIGHGQTISQPYTISFMLMLLELKDNLKILEVGSGSGYVLSLINEISKNSELYGIERIKEIFEKSNNILKNKKNIKIIYSDGSKGLKKDAPFDRILVSASSETIPQKLVAQLKIGGILVAPIKNSVVKIRKFANENKIEEYPGFVFVPLIKG